MIRCSAGYDVDLVETFDVFLCHCDAVQVDLPCFCKSVEESILDSLRLLVDLFEHEVLVAFLFGSICIPAYVEYFSVDRLAIFVIYVDFVLGQDDSLVVLDQIYLSAVFEERRNIRCYKVETFADSRYQRCILTNCDDLVGLVRRDDGDGICSPHVLNGLVDCLEKISIIVYAHKVCYNFGVSFRSERYSVFPLQPLAYLLIVLDDAVVDNSDGVVLIAVWVGVYIARSAVCRPTRVPDTDRSIKIISADDLFEVFDLANVLSYLDLVADRKSDSGGIVTSVFKTLESVYYLFFCVF